MRFAIVAVAALVLCACSELAPSEEETVSSLLQADRPEVCASEDVQRTALTIVEQDYQDYLDEGGEPLSFEAISATGIEPAIHEVSCSANVRLPPSFFERLAAMRTLEETREVISIAYTVSPSLTDGADFVVSIEANPGLRLRINDLIQQYREPGTESGQATAAEADTSEEVSPTNDETPAPEVEGIIPAAEPTADEASSEPAIDDSSELDSNLPSPRP